MSNHLLPKTTLFIAAALIFGIFAIAPAWAPAYGDSTDALLLQARRDADQLNLDAAHMEAYTRTKPAPMRQAEDTRINVIKNHINKVSKVITDLHNARPHAKKWQQDAIDRITPLLREMASNTQTLIDHMKENKPTWTPKYKELVKSNARLSADLAKLINDDVDYSNARFDVQQYGQALGLSMS